MRRLAIAAASCLVLLAGCGGDEATTTSAEDPIAAVTGAWEGVLHQKATAPFPVEVSINSSSDPAANVVRYGGAINCSGTWRYLGTDGSSVEFEEVIDSGQGGRCKGRGSVTVTPDGAELDYEFSGGGVVSRGVLREAVSEY